MNFKNLFKNTLVLLFALVVSTSAFGQATNSIKWHPGHYAMLVEPSKDSARYMAGVYKDLDANPTLRGIAIRYTWDELESSKDNYNFTSLDKILVELGKRNKQLMILIEVKSFRKAASLVPSYLKTPEYDGGVFEHTKGYNVKLWNSKVRDRLDALVTAMGHRFDSHPNFEGLGLQETAMGKSIKPLTSVQYNDYYKNLLIVNQQMRNSFPNTMSFQLTNYPRPMLPTLMEGWKTMGMTVGATDIFLQEPGLFFKATRYSPQGLYHYFPGLNGEIPLLAQVERPNYLDTKHDGSGYKPTITELFNFGRDKLFVNYILWTRTPEFFDDVLAKLRQKEQTKTPSGGLVSTCPSKFVCKND